VSRFHTFSQVQDILNPEYYVGAFKDSKGSWHTTKYNDPTHDVLSDVQEQRIWERKVYYCVPVPGESSWCTSRFSDNDSATTAAGEVNARPRPYHRYGPPCSEQRLPSRASMNPPAARSIRTNVASVAACMLPAGVVSQQTTMVLASLSQHSLQLTTCAVDNSTCLHCTSCQHIHIPSNAATRAPLPAVPRRRCSSHEAPA
jgi:hypothetical protein